LIQTAGDGYFSGLWKTEQEKGRAQYFGVIRCLLGWR
jgi:hypothetical protein